jgi:protease YdgD
VEQDYAEAVKWFRFAAEQGRADAQYALGSMYLNGRGVKQDYILAYMWFDLSAAQKKEIAVTGRDQAARQMTPTQIVEARKLAGDWKPKPHREIVDVHQFPWSSIGKVGSGGLVCTGSVIGPNQFLTAAHCLYNIAAARFMSAGSINILLGYEKGGYRVHRVASRYTIPPAYDPSLITYPPDPTKLRIAARYDWAIVYIDEPFPADVRPLRLASATPSPGTAIRVVGYPIERPHIITADPHCRVAEISSDKKLFSHDCVAHHGDSGGPVLSRDDEGLILGVSVLVPGLLVELREQSKKAGIAVSAASISEFLGSQSGAGPSQTLH